MEAVKTEAPTLDIPLVKSPARCPMCGAGGHSLAPMMNARCECGGVMVHIESAIADCPAQANDLAAQLAAAHKQIEILEGQLVQAEAWAQDARNEI